MIIAQKWLRYARAHMPKAIGMQLAERCPFFMGGLENNMQYQTGPLDVGFLKWGKPQVIHLERDFLL